MLQLSNDKCKRNEKLQLFNCTTHKEEHYLLGSDAMYSLGRSLSTFWRNVLLTSSVHEDISVQSSEMSVNLYQTT